MGSETEVLRKTVKKQLLTELQTELANSRQLIASLTTQLNIMKTKDSVQNHRFKQLAFNSSANELIIYQQQNTIDKERKHEAMLMQEVESLSKTIATLSAEMKLIEDKYHIINHDIRGAIVMWLNTADLLLADPGLSQQGVQILREAKASGVSMLGFVDMFLSLSKIECADFEVELEVVNAVDVVMSVISQNKKIINDKQLSLPPPSGAHGHVAKTCYIYCCLSMTNIILNNLLVNAIEASPVGAEIKVTFEKNDHRKISIHNFGEVPEKIRNVFFDKFVTSGKRNGTGIGTYSAMLMAKAQNGDILADFSEPGATTITIIFQKPPEI